MMASSGPESADRAFDHLWKARGHEEFELRLAEALMYPDLKELSLAGVRAFERNGNIDRLTTLSRLLVSAGARAYNSLEAISRNPSPDSGKEFFLDLILESEALDEEQKESLLIGFVQFGGERIKEAILECLEEDDSDVRLMLLRLLNQSQK